MTQSWAPSKHTNRKSSARASLFCRFRKNVSRAARSFVSLKKISELLPTYLRSFVHFLCLRKVQWVPDPSSRPSLIRYLASRDYCTLCVARCIRESVAEGVLVLLLPSSSPLTRPLFTPETFKLRTCLRLHFNRDSVALSWLLRPA